MSARKNGEDQREAHPAAVAYERRQRRNRRLDMAKTAAPIIVFALIVVGYVTFSGKHGNTGSAAGAPNMSATSTSSCFAGEAGCGSMSAPYADSPAAAWPDGAAGIVLPAVTAVGGFSSEAVSSDLALSKQFVVDQSLIPAVLDQGATPAAMLSLMTPSSNFSGKIVSEIAVATQTNNPTNVFVRFDPKTSVLLATPKVSGTVTYSQVQAGTLQVDVSLKIAYALKKPDGSAWTRTVATLSDELQFFDGDGSYASAPGTVWPYLIGLTDYAGVECGFTGGFVEPQYLTAGGSSQPLSGAPVDPYATATAGPTPTVTPTISGCQPLSRI